jgi:hypothetical protein
LIPEPVFIDGKFVPQNWEWPMPGTEDFRRTDPEAYVGPMFRIVQDFAILVEKGILPVAGGILDQPSKLMAGIKTYLGAVNHCTSLCHKSPGEGVPQSG